MCLVWKGGVPGPGGHLVRGGLASQHALRQTPSPLWTRQTPVKTLPWPNFIAAGKNAKTLKPFYTVSDSDENEEKRKDLQQVDGNGSDCVVMSTTAGSNILFGSSIEECGDKISLAPALSMPSCVTISDTSAKHSNGNSNANADDSHANSNALRLTCLLKHYDSEKTVFCDLCPENFFTLDRLLRHNKSVHDSEESDTSQSEYPLAEC